MASASVGHRAHMSGARGLARLRAPFFGAVGGLLLTALSTIPSLAEDTNNPPGPVTAGTATVDTNALETLRVLTDVESRLSANQTAIEENRKELREAVAQNADLLSKTLQSMGEVFSKQQQALSERYEREVEALQSSNRLMVILAGVFAGVASLALLMVAYFQWRMSKVWADLALGVPVTHRLGAGLDSRELGQGEDSPAGGRAADANTRLFDALATLETRVHDLETSAPAGRTRAENPPPPGDGNSHAERTKKETSVLTTVTAGRENSQVVAWLEQAQTLVKQNDWEGALNCFNEILASEPTHGEALVKKGAALEHLKRLNEAFECYDRAIAVDDSMTIAYLHKGGLCSRLERFKEALDCYEKALKTHDGW